MNMVMNVRLSKQTVFVDGVHWIYESLPYIACFGSEARYLIEWLFLSL
jgi:hypothetical protein